MLRSEAAITAQPPPPKAPNTMSTNWPHFALHPPATTTTLAPHHFLPAGGSQLHSWVDEFLDFSATRRRQHRHSASDSVAFLEAPPLVDEEGGFDRLDDDHLMSMFSDDVPTPSTPSDHNSINGDDKRMDQASQATVAAGAENIEEAQSACKMELEAVVAETVVPAPVVGSESVVDPKRVKRIVANRQSAQRSRVRKLQYISELERGVTCLQRKVSCLSPRVAFLDQQRSILTMGNSHLKQRIAALAQDNIFKDAHQEALKKEIDRLRQLYQQQQKTCLDSMNTASTVEPATARNCSTDPSD